MIIEAALLTDEEKITACTLAKAAGADYVKTSTGFGPGGATPADVALMRRVVGAEMGVKAAGGVRDLEGLKAMVAAGATRVGASAGVKIVQQARGEKAARPPAAAIDESSKPCAVDQRHVAPYNPKMRWRQLRRRRADRCRAGRRCFGWHRSSTPSIAAPLLLLTVVLIARFWGTGPALLAAASAAASFSYYFLPPAGFAIDDPDDWVAFVTFMVTAIVVGELPRAPSGGPRKPSRDGGRSNGSISSSTRRSSAPARPKRRGATNSSRRRCSTRCRTTCGRR